MPGIIGVWSQHGWHNSRMHFRSLAAGLALACAALAAQADGYQIGAITIERPYARATLPGQPTGGAYLRLDNRGPADRLVAVKSDIARSVELHEMKMEGDVMRMRQLEAIDVPANQATVLKPGGLHLMLMGLKAPLKQGQRFAMTLKFEKAGEVKVEVPVDAVQSGGATHHKH
jgi:copper(I)-binding protein